MEFPKLLLNIIILISATVTCTDIIVRHESSTAMNPLYEIYIKPLHYETTMMLIDKGNFYGECNISVSILYPTQFIRFYSRQVNINDKEIVVRNIGNKMVYKPVEYLYNFKTFVNIIYFDVKLPPGFYAIYISFIGIITNNDNANEDALKTLFTTQLQKKQPKWLFGAYSHAVGTKRVFPCLEESTFQASFSIIIEHPKNWKALANSPVCESYRDATDKLWTYCKNTLVIPMYVAWIALIDMKDFILVESKNNITKIYEIGTCNIEFAQSIIENVTISLEDLGIKTTNAFHMIIQNYQHQVMDNWAVTFHRKNEVMYNKNVDTITRKLKVAFRVAFKTTHQSLFNTIRLAKLSDIWLTEALSIWIATFLINKTMPNMQIMDLFVVQTQHESLHLDSYSRLIPFVISKSSKINSPFGYYQYIKAPVILRMLYYTLSSNIFWNGLRMFINKHQTISATPDDLWDAMENALIHSNDTSINFNLKTAINTWIKEKNYPILNVKRDYKIGYIEIDILKSKDDFESNENIWFIPITYVTRTNPNFNQIWLNKTKWLEPLESNLTLPKIALDDWIIVNVQQAGYYRVNYDKRNWLRLARFLKTCQYHKIHVLNRAQIIDDAFHFLMAGHLHLSIFLELMEYLKQETNYIAWYPMIKAFEYMSGYFPFPESASFKKHMEYILNELLMNLGYEEQAKETLLNKQLRKEAIKWLCTISQCKRTSTEVNHYIKNLPEQQFLLGWNNWFHCKRLQTSASTKNWNRMVTIKEWDEYQDNYIFESLACSEDPKIILEYSKLLKLNNYLKKIDDRDHTRIFFDIICKHAKNDTVLKFLLSNFNTIKPGNINVLTILTVMVNYIYSMEHLTMIKKFAKGEVQENEYLKFEIKIKIRASQIQDQWNIFQYLLI